MCEKGIRCEFCHFRHPGQARFTWAHMKLLLGGQEAAPLQVSPPEGAISPGASLLRVARRKAIEGAWGAFEKGRVEPARWPCRGSGRGAPGLGGVVVVQLVAGLALLAAEGQGAWQGQGPQGREGQGQGAEAQGGAEDPRTSHL